MTDPEFSDPPLVTSTPPQSGDEVKGAQIKDKVSLLVFVFIKRMCLSKSIDFIDSMVLGSHHKFLYFLLLIGTRESSTFYQRETKCILPKATENWVGNFVWTYWSSRLSWEGKP